MNVQLELIVRQCECCLVAAVRQKQSVHLHVCKVGINPACAANIAVVKDGAARLPHLREQERRRADWIAAINQAERHTVELGAQRLALSRCRGKGISERGPAQSRTSPVDYASAAAPVTSFQIRNRLLRSRR